MLTQEKTIKAIKQNKKTEVFATLADVQEVAIETSETHINEFIEDIEFVGELKAVLKDWDEDASDFSDAYLAEWDEEEAFSKAYRYFYAEKEQVFGTYFIKRSALAA